MEPVLLGLAATSAASEAISLLEHAFHSVAEPFANVLNAVSEAIATEDDESLATEIGDLQTYVGKLETGLAEKIQHELAAAGVELTEPLQLRISEVDGRLEVVGEHPQRALIESALANDPDLVSGISELIALRQMLSASAEIDEASSGNVLLGTAESDVTANFTIEDGQAKLTIDSQNELSELA
jgi:hypothetical protein